MCKVAKYIALCIDKSKGMHAHVNWIHVLRAIHTLYINYYNLSYSV